jgi:hypothetical protein
MRLFASPIPDGLHLYADQVGAMNLLRVCRYKISQSVESSRLWHPWNFTPQESLMVYRRSWKIRFWACGGRIRSPYFSVLRSRCQRRTKIALLWRVKIAHSPFFV